MDDVQYEALLLRDFDPLSTREIIASVAAGEISVTDAHYAIERRIAAARIAGQLPHLSHHDLLWYCVDGQIRIPHAVAEIERRIAAAAADDPDDTSA